MKRQRYFLLLALAGITMAAAPAAAQAGRDAGRPGEVAVEATIGYAGFIDESMINHFVAGGAGRVRATSRVWLGGEVLHMWGPGEDRDWLLMPLVTIDLRTEGIVPYVVGGAGLLRNTIRVGTGPYTSNSWTVGGGGGVRFPVGSRGYLAVEGRLGTEPVTRVTVSFGIRLQ